MWRIEWEDNVGLTRGLEKNKRKYKRSFIWKDNSKIIR